MIFLFLEELLAVLKSHQNPDIFRLKQAYHTDYLHTMLSPVKHCTRIVFSEVNPIVYQYKNFITC